MSRMLSSAALALAMLSLPAQAATDSGIGSILSEVKGGVLLHDVARDNETKNNETDSIDLNVEILFNRITFFDTGNRTLNLLVQPRPHLGGQVNVEGFTNQAYFGLTWDYRFESGPFIEFAFGFSVHDGQLTGKMPSNDLPNLGSPVLFREGLDLGYRFASGHSLALHGSHISHAGLFAKENDGMNFLGLRYGYRFD